ncbi:MAG: hypothetical protein IEMM0006_1826 [bacterium]|nr:MAG: hypothetical protein IEMM0006_1826 [bacterium]
MLFFIFVVHLLEIMKKFTKIFSLIVFIFLGFITTYGQTVDSNAVDGQIYFQLKTQMPATFRGEKGALAVGQIAFLKTLNHVYKISSVASPFFQTDDSKLQRTYLLKFKNIQAVDSLILDLKKNKNIAYAEKAPLFRILYTPNDPEYGSSNLHRWYLKAIHAEQAWDIQKGNPHIKIAIVDNAIYVDHPDLKNKIVKKIDLANGDTDPTPPKQTMEWSHGTHTSGLAGAETDNSIGIASIGFNISLIAVKISSDSTSGKTMSFGYQGIVWAADHGANVINMSWGGPGFYQTGQNVVNYAYNKGSVLVASAGNDGNTSPSYPADYHHVIAVASTNSDDTKSSFSQYGKAIDVCAPGGSNAKGYGIYSTVDLVAAKYGYMEGTSMASPIVAGLAGLMLSEDSTLTPEKLTAIMKATSDNIDAENPGYAGQLGAGRINAFKAIEAVKDSMVLHTVIANFQASTVSVPEGGDVSFTDLSSGNPVSWSWDFEGGNPSHSTLQNPSNIKYSKPGSFEVTLTISNGTKSNTEIKTNFILVYPLVSGAWLPQATGFTAQSRGINYISIVSLSPDVVWANAYDGSGNGTNVQEFTKTIDGGKTWKPGKYTGVPIDNVVSSITATDKNKAWISMYKKSGTAGRNGIFVTTNGGASWTQQTSAAFINSKSFPDVVYFWDDQNGVSMGDPINNYFEIYTTTNGGIKWTPVSTANIPVSLSGEYGYTDLYTVYGNTMWFGTNKGRVYKSKDKGLHWTVASTGLADFSTLGFHNDSIGIATYTKYSKTGDSITGFLMVKSVDGGTTWTTVTPSGKYYKSDMAVIPEAPGILISTGISQDLARSGSAYSMDEGNTWTMLDDSIQYTSVKFYSSAVGWAGGFNLNSTSRGIWKWLGIPTTAVNEIPGGSGIKIYPNPSSGIVHFYVPEVKKIFEISVFDMQGRLIKHIQGRVVNSSHEYILNLRQLKKGFYIAVLKVDHTVIKKEFVIK